MNQKNEFFKTVCKIAVPVTLQNMLQSSFSMVDQMMIGQLGSVSIAAIGLAGKFSSIFSVLVSAVAAVAGIMIAQYMGKQHQKEVDRSFSVNLVAVFFLAAVFLAAGFGIPGRIMGIYTGETEICQVAAVYLKILSFSFLPMAGSAIVSTMFRCMERAALPLYAGGIAVAMNTVFNYILIFGKCGFPKMGVKGAAIATVISQIANFLFIFCVFIRVYQKEKKRFQFSLRLGKTGYYQYFVMLLPILVTEFLWSLGENVYAFIYGHMGTQPCAAMTLTNPIQGLMIGALGGVSQAAGILIGKALGKKEYERAYRESKKLMWYGLFGSLILSVGLLILSRFYVEIYQVESGVKQTAAQILFVFALISPVKVQNMILGGGIIRSGGKTKYVMWIDIIGTWLFGVPLGLLAAFVWGLSIPLVYFILSLEEVVRLVISFVVFKKRGWMQSLTLGSDDNSRSQQLR